MALLVFGEVHSIIDRVDNLTEQDAIFHVVIGVGERRFYNHLSQRCILGKLKIRQSLEKVVVDEVQQLIAGKGVAVFRVRRPAVPAQTIGDDRLIRIVVKFPFLFLRIINL